MKKNFLLVALLAGSLGVNSFAATEIYVKASTGNDSYNGASWNTAFKTVSKAIGSVVENEETIIYRYCLSAHCFGRMYTIEQFRDHHQSRKFADYAHIQGCCKGHR